MSIEKTIKQLGDTNNKLLFFGGVYSNLQALQAMQQWAVANDFTSENIFCTGDILGYCAQPMECIELISKWGIHCIAGNVELQVRNGEDDCGCDFNPGGRCDLLSKNWYTYIQHKMTPQAFDWLNALPDHIQLTTYGRQLTIVHGSWFHTAAFIFKSTPWQTKQADLNACGSDIIIAGHCGLPFADVQNGQYWLNPGVIGMPANDGETAVWFMTLDGQHTPIYQFHRLVYDHGQAARLMHENNLPATYAQTLLTGIWDNCEILPGEETLLQGKKIEV